ncbi:hypothetical protein D3C76_1698580 [compost metagenome]
MSDLAGHLVLPQLFEPFSGSESFLLVVFYFRGPLGYAADFHLILLESSCLRSFRNRSFRRRLNDFNMNFGLLRISRWFIGFRQCGIGWL